MVANYPSTIKQFIAKWKPGLLLCPPIETTDDKARRRRSMFGKWEVFAAVIARRGESFVIVKQRPAESHVGGWSIPGGAVEKGETVEQGAVREAREEAGVDVELFGPTTLVRTAITAPSESSLEYALAIFSARVSGGVITPIDTKEIAKVRVASFHQIDLLIEPGQFPSLHPKIDRAVIEFFGRIAAS